MKTAKSIRGRCISIKHIIVYIYMYMYSLHGVQYQCSYRNTWNKITSFEGNEIFLIDIGDMENGKRIASNLKNW